MLFAGIAMLISVLTFIVLICYKDIFNSSYFILLSIAVSVYLVGNFVEITNLSLDGSIAGLNLRFFGVPFIPTLWYLCVREFCGLTFKNKYSVFLLFVIPIFISFLATTWSSNHLLFLDVEMMNNSNYGNLKIIPGPLYMARLYYQMGISLLGVLTIIWCYRKGTKRFKKQALLFLISVLVPLFNIAVFMVPIGTSIFDITPYGISISMALFSYALYRYGVLNLSSIIKNNATDQLFEGMLLFDRDKFFMDSNSSAQQILPQIKNVPMGTHMDEMDYLPFQSASLQERENGTHQLSEFSREYDGVITTFNVSISNICYRNQLIGYSVIFNNISPLKRLFTELETKSSLDALTNIFNRGHLFKLGESIVSKLQYTQDDFCVIMFDLDHFKQVNDTYGHLFGDYVLKTVATISSANLRASDIIGRYGGEEFCVFLQNTSLDGAYKKAELLRSKIYNYLFENEGTRIKITVSLGVAFYDRSLPNDTLLDIVKRADENLYKAKNSGRNKVC